MSKAWTYVVWAAFLFLAPLWVVLWYERHPILGILQAGLIIWFLGSHAVAELRRDTRRDTAQHAPHLPRASGR